MKLIIRGLLEHRLPSVGADMTIPSTATSQIQKSEETILPAWEHFMLICDYKAVYPRRPLSICTKNSMQQRSPAKATSRHRLKSLGVVVDAYYVGAS